MYILKLKEAMITWQLFSCYFRKVDITKQWDFLVLPWGSPRIWMRQHGPGYGFGNWGRWIALSVKLGRSQVQKTPPETRHEANLDTWQRRVIWSTQTKDKVIKLIASISKTFIHPYMFLWNGSFFPIVQHHCV